MAIDLAIRVAVWALKEYLVNKLDSSLNAIPYLCSILKRGEFNTIARNSRIIL
jgi:hypothetical protein